MLDFKTINLDKIVHHKPRKNKGKYIGKVLYDDNEITIKTPFLRCMGPISISENRCSIELELDTDDRDLYDFFADLDDININTAYQNSNTWFEDQFPLDVIDDYYKGFIRFNTKIRRPYIKIKIPYDTKILLKHCNVDDFKQNVLISATLHHDGLRFYKQQFTSEWSLVDYEIENNYEFKENVENDVSNGFYENILNKTDEDISISKDINDVEKIVEEVVEKNIVNNEIKEDIKNEEKTLETEEVKKDDAKRIKINKENKKKDKKNDKIKVEKHREENIEEHSEEKKEEEKSENIAEKNHDDIIEKKHKNVSESKKDKKKKKEKKDKKKKHKIIKYAHKNRIWN